MNVDDLITLNDEIAGMARAGLPLDQGLASLARDMGRGRLRRVTLALAEDLRAGHTLPEALARQKGKVPPFYAGLVAAGARSGRVAEVLATLTEYARTVANLRSILLDALFYPVIVIVFAFVLFGFLCVFVVPQFERIFHDFNLRLPYISQLFIGAAHHPVALLLVPTLAVIFFWMLVNVFLGYLGGGPGHWANFIYSIPVFGTLVRAARLAAFTELLGILVDNQLPLPEAFLLAGQASSEPIMAATAHHVHDELSQGRPLGEVLRGRGLVPEWVSWMTGLGEHRGNLGKALHQIAEMYRRQVEMRAALLRSLLPPFFIICTAGIFVSFFVFAMMLPLIKLIEGLSK
jgi:type II secretory pathway component PulF